MEYTSEAGMKKGCRERGGRESKGKKRVAKGKDWTHGRLLVLFDATSLPFLGNAKKISGVGLRLVEKKVEGRLVMREKIETVK